MERAKSHAELPADESTGEQGQEIESKEEPTTSNGPRPAMAMERERKTGLLTKPQPPIQLGSG